MIATVLTGCLAALPNSNNSVLYNPKDPLSYKGGLDR